MLQLPKELSYVPKASLHPERDSPGTVAQLAANLAKLSKSLDTVNMELNFSDEESAAFRVVLKVS